MIRQAIIAEARSWIGTPWRHQARVKGVGCDCAQLVIAVGTALGIVTVPPEEWQRFSAYGRTPNPTHMRAALEAFMVEIAAADAQPGDVMWLEWRADLPMHLAILSEADGRATMIHAVATACSSTFPTGKAVEHGFTAEWPGMVSSWWRYPGVTG